MGGGGPPAGRDERKGCVLAGCKFHFYVYIESKMFTSVSFVI